MSSEGLWDAYKWMRRSNASQTKMAWSLADEPRGRSVRDARRAAARMATTPRREATVVTLTIEGATAALMMGGGWLGSGGSELSRKPRRKVDAG